MNAKKVIKHAYLIGAPGHGKHFLRGVGKDLQNVKRFLMSSYGGAWLESEITILPFAEWRLIKNRLEGYYEDFRLVYFSGHGFLSSDNYNCIEFQDGWVADFDLVHPFILKQTIICDSCRVFKDMARIGGIDDDKTEDWINADGYNEVRELYNQWISESPNGLQIFHAVPAGRAARDTSDGGLFTNSIIHAVENCMTPMNDYSWSTLSQVTDYLRHPSISRNQVERMPQMTYSEGDLKIPFGVCSPAARSANVIFQLEPQYSQVDWGGLALLTLGVTVVASLLDKR